MSVKSNSPIVMNQINMGAAPFALTPTGSPYVYHNTTGMNLDVLVTGGTVATIYVSVDGTAWTLVGILSGQIHLSPGWYLQINYVLAPVVTAFPF